MRKLFTYCIVSCLLINNATAQQYCYNCNGDSLYHVALTTKSKEEKIRLLGWLYESTKTDEENARNQKEVWKLFDEATKDLNTVEIQAYRKMHEGYTYADLGEWTKAKTALQDAVELFDQKKMVISILLSNLRIVFNYLNDLEGRLAYYEKKLQYYQVNGPVENTASCYHAIGGYYLQKNDYNNAINAYLKAAEIYKPFFDGYYMNEIGVTGNTYALWGNTRKAKQYISEALPLAEKLKDSSNMCFLLNSLASVSIIEKKPAEAMQYLLQSIPYLGSPLTRALNEAMTGYTYLLKNDSRSALPYLQRSKDIQQKNNLPFISTAGELETNYYLYLYHLQRKEEAEAEKSLLNAYAEAKLAGNIPTLLKYSRALSLFYARTGNPVDAYNYGQAHFQMADSMSAKRGAANIALYESEQKETSQQERINKLKDEAMVKQATIDQRNLTLWIALIGFIAVCALAVFVYRQLHLNKRILSRLRNTQSQLVQQEKMASLGELTAGIAHEIQNPLNFVNNFSELSKELAEELKEELDNNNLAAAKHIAGDIANNAQKIVHHGRRADSIVKNMLQHSRSNSGKKAPADINALTDEYLRLSYHGLRSKDKTFNAEYKTAFDESVGMISIVQQDVGRVLLNLFTNAFYALNEKRKQSDASYQPLLEVGTKNESNHIIIRIKDNGTGIPQKAAEKVWQPFFTTKPTGEGTGLGLSLSYDIITKGHGGSLVLNNKEGEGAEFIITLPKT